MMLIKCENCGYKEPLNKELFVKILGGVTAGFGFWAWVAYLFAGTGFALPICIALVTGGIAIAAFSTEITLWLSKKYSCPVCKCKNWIIVEK